MIDWLVFLPLVTAAVVAMVPSTRPRLVRGVALAGAGSELALVAVVWITFVPSAGLQRQTVLSWIPGLGASYAVGVDGVSLTMIATTALLFLVVSARALDQTDRAKPHALLFLLMQTGLTGVFASQDLLLFYLFFEVSLVPMYFVIGGFGHARRRHAALKFFLYTRAGSLAMLLSFLALFLASSSHTFSLPALAAEEPLNGAGATGSVVFLGLILGFGVKLPMVPLHNWLPDAHVEAPTEGSVILAGLHLKIGAYGLVRVAAPIMSDALAKAAWPLAVLGVASILYGAIAALGQSDLKRLVAYTSVAHMGFVTLAVAALGLATEPGDRALALGGATLQMASHALLTGGMFLVAGLFEEHWGTRDLAKLCGAARRTPSVAVVLAVLAFGSLGLPGMSGFVAELQVLGATLAYSTAVAVFAVVGIVIATGLYVSLVSRLVLATPEGSSAQRRLPRGVALPAVVAALAVVLGLWPWSVLRLVAHAAR